MHRLIILILLSVSVLLLPWVVWAQTEDQDLDQVEAEIKKPDTTLTQHQEKKEVSDTKVETLSDLSHLQSFSDVSVLQRRYMPKTGRFQFFAGLAAMMNDPWNSSYGGSLRVAYGFTEAWAVEGTGYFMSSTPSQASNDLLSQNNVSAQSFGAMTGYTGGSVVWTPIYGKMSLFSRRIIPFDMYFSLGGGSTTLNGSTVSAASGLSVGTGQIYALTRGMGFRWDLTWNAYSIPAGSINNLLLSLGLSFYFPEAKYR